MELTVRSTSSSRRSSLLAALLVLAASIAAAQSIPATGTAFPGMASYDAFAASLMTKYQIPGGAIAVVRYGKLVFARGYGYADVDAHELVEPDSLFRVASLSKPITSAAILKLVEEGRLDLDAKVFSILNQYPLPPNADSRLQNITIRELLDHSGGWNVETTFDPMFIPFTIANAMGVPPPATPDAIIRYMLDKPLQFTPGQEFEYSNFGYCLLARVIEKITGLPYELYVQSTILLPAGVSCMRIGHSLQSQRFANEVRYYDFPGAPLTTSIYGSGSVAWPDGGFDLEALDSAGGWIASTVDYLRFVTAVDGLPTRTDVLLPATIQMMVARPPAPLWAGQPVWYALGWIVRPVGNDANWWHTGGLPGSSTFVVRLYNGVEWAAFFNSLPENSDAFYTDLDNGLANAFLGVTEWPDVDQFSSFAACPTPPRRRTTFH